MSKCPSCDSSNVKKMSMVWLSGTRTSNKSGGGVSVSNRGRISVSTGGGSSTSQSHLASLCEPPKVSKLHKYILFIVFIWFWLPITIGIFAVFTTESSIIVKLLKSILCIGLSGGIGYAMYIYYNNAESKNNEILKHYNRQWVCLKCGSIFE